jgi:hypothetical protein
VADIVVSVVVNAQKKPSCSAPMASPRVSQGRGVHLVGDDGPMRAAAGETAEATGRSGWIGAQRAAQGELTILASGSGLLCEGAPGAG